MSKAKSSKSKATNTPEFNAHVAQFISVTNVSQKEAVKFIQRYGKADLAIDAYYNDPNDSLSSSGGGSGKGPNVSTQKLTVLFDGYKALGSEDDNISIDGTLKFCEDLAVDPEDVVLLAVAYELKAPGVGVFTREGWKTGWRALNVDSISGMKSVLTRLRKNLASDFTYFKKVYLFTFDFAKSEGQRSLSMDVAQAFWALLLPHAIDGGALTRVDAEDADEDENMGQTAGPGWSNQHTQLWFDFLNEKGGKGISRDTWNMFISFAHTIDPKLEKYDSEAAWPSIIDEFVEWAKSRL